MGAEAVMSSDMEAANIAKVRQDRWALYYVPKKQHTEAVCKAAVQQDGEALKYVPEEHLF